MKNYMLQKRFNMSSEEFYAMAKEQDNKCGICHRHVKLVVDHDHKNGKVRGLLCSECNSGLGYFFENRGSMLSAIEYLNKHNTA